MLRLPRLHPGTADLSPIMPEHHHPCSISTASLFSKIETHSQHRWPLLMIFPHTQLPNIFIKSYLVRMLQASVLLCRYMSSFICCTAAAVLLTRQTTASLQDLVEQPR